MNLEEQKTISEIHSRWVKVSLISEWLHLEKKQQENVIQELEETARQAADYDKELSNNITAALDALEYLSMHKEFDILNQASEDILYLLKKIPNPKS